MRENKDPKRTDSSALAEFSCLFNQEKFFEAHEVLEIAWRNEKGKTTKAGQNQWACFYQGLIQIAAAFVHIQRQNLGGAEKLLDSAYRYLETLPPVYGGIDIRTLMAETRQCLSVNKPFPKLYPS